MHRSHVFQLAHACSVALDSEEFPAHARAHAALLSTGHASSGTLTSTTAHPHAPTYATTGDDGTLHVWCTRTHVSLARVRLPGPGRACAFSCDGKRVAVAYGKSVRGPGGRVAADCEEGHVAVYTYMTGDAPGQTSAGTGVALECELTIRPSRQRITSLRYSPDNKTLCVGGHDNSVHMHDTTAGYALASKQNKHNAPVLCMDFSGDSVRLQVTFVHVLRTGCGVPPPLSACTEI